MEKRFQTQPNQGPSATSSDLTFDLLADVPHKPSSELAEEGWDGLMREVRNQGFLVVSHESQPQAVLLSVESYERLARLAQREQVRQAEQLAELKDRFDRRLECLNSPSGRLALDAFMNEPVELAGEVSADSAK